MSRRRHSDENDGELHEFPLILASWLTVCMARGCVFLPVFKQDLPPAPSLFKCFTRSPLIGQKVDYVLSVKAQTMAGFVGIRVGLKPEALLIPLLSQVGLSLLVVRCLNGNLFHPKVVCMV